MLQRVIRRVRRPVEAWQPLIYISALVCLLPPERRISLLGDFRAFRGPGGGVHRWEAREATHRPFQSPGVPRPPAYPSHRTRRPAGS
eukprot:8909116-Pyramimonas_sp.AAC.1